LAYAPEVTLNRLISIVAVALAMVIAVPIVAMADEAPPTPAQLDQAKKAFAEGKKLHDAGKLPESIEKFKESYRLSKNPLLLYNIGLTMEEAGMEDLALFYYRKFLTDAPQDAGQRPTVTERVKVLEKKFNPGGTTPDPVKPPDDGTKPPPVDPTPTGPKTVAIKPVGTYSDKDFEHITVDAAPPGKPLDVTAVVPEDSGFVVTLFYRTAGEGKFTTKTMKWRYKELVARIPAPKMIGSAVQYYLEAKDAAGTVVARNGKSTSPNQVLLEAGATPRFYPDVTDDGDAKLSPTEIKKRDDDDDPLNKTKKRDDGGVVIQPTEPSAPGHGFADVGSSKFTYAKWGSTIGAAVFLGFGAFAYVQAGSYAKSLEDDSVECGSPPCRAFDSTAQDWQSSGKSYETYAKIGLGVGIAATAVAGYFWYKELTAKKRGEMKVSKSSASPETSSWLVAPSISEGYTGAAAAVRF
jgi:tetratricopeptide (TPR) repeat protein